LHSRVSREILQLLANQRYHLVGNHSAVKRCRWLYETLVHDRACYKQKFYGIRTHQCIQMTPAVVYCTMRCLFCWRLQSGDLEMKWGEMELPRQDDPEEIVKGCITEQLKILSGYKGNPQTNQEKYKEALTPKHAAISLSGEPTLYSSLGDLIHGFHKRGFTTFLVSNGTVPEALSQLSEEPTQLYISVSAFDKKTFRETCRPQISAAWEKLNETLSMLHSFKCPTVIRMTLAKRVNMKRPERYAQLIEKANPTYVEPKAYMHVGFSRLRLGFVLLAEELGYNILDESSESRVVLLSRLKKPIRLA